MPGNEIRDRAHNFFAQDHSFQEEHQQLVLQGNWPMLNNNFRSEGQRENFVLNSSTKSYIPQNSDAGGGQENYSVQGRHNPSIFQLNLNHHSAIPNELPYSNGFVYGDQFYQTMENDAMFMTVETESNKFHLVNSAGLSVQELQQGNGHDPKAISSDGSRAFGPSTSFNLFGSDHQMNHQEAKIFQTFQNQQSGLADIHQLQQKLMIRKLQELQNQQQLNHDSQPLNLINHSLPFNKEASGSQSSTMLSSTPYSDGQYPWTLKPGSNLSSRGFASLRKSPSRGNYLSSIGQTQGLMDSVPQQFDQSLYGVTVPGSRGLAVKQHSQVVTNKSSVSNSAYDNQHNFLPDRTGIPEGTSVLMQKFQDENQFGHVSNQSQNTEKMEMWGLQQVNSLPRNTPHQDSLSRSELGRKVETPLERNLSQASSTPHEVSLDPTEEKILYGSDDNMWAAFGYNLNMSGETNNIFSKGVYSNGYSSIQSGSWSALMQSAVAETSSNDTGPVGEWSGFVFHTTNGSSANQDPSMHDTKVRQTCSPHENTQIPSAMISATHSTSDDVPAPIANESNKLSNSFLNEADERLPTDKSPKFGLSLGGSKWANHTPTKNPVAEASQIHANAVHYSLDTERKAPMTHAIWAAAHGVTRKQSKARNASESVRGGRWNSQDNEKSSEKSLDNQLRVMEGQSVHGNALWKPNSLSGSAEVGNARLTVLDHQENKGPMSLNYPRASVPTSSNMRIGDEVSPFVQNSYFLNQCKSAQPSTRVQVGERLGGMIDQVNEQNQNLDLCPKDENTRHDVENSYKEGNSNNSHHSNLSQHASGGIRECGLSDASDSRSLPHGKHKATNKLAGKNSVPRKFQFHPMGNCYNPGGCDRNLDQNFEPTSVLHRPTMREAIPLQNIHFGHSKSYVQAPSGTEKDEVQKDYIVPDEEPSSWSLPNHAPSVPDPFTKPLDSYTIANASSPSQNMLDLIHKVDQSRDNGTARHLNSAECTMSSQLPELGKAEGSLSRLQCSHSSASEGFALQLGPPSQWQQAPNLSSSLIVQDTATLQHSTHDGAGTKERGQMVPTSRVLSWPSPHEESVHGFKNYDSHPGRAENTIFLHKTLENCHPASILNNPHARYELENKPVSMVSGKVAPDQHVYSSFNNNGFLSMPRGYGGTISPDVSCSIKNNIASVGDMAKQGDTRVYQGGAPAGKVSIMDQMTSSEHFSMPGISNSIASTQLADSPTQHSFTNQYLKAPSDDTDQPKSSVIESSSQGFSIVDKGYNLLSKSSGVDVTSPGDAEQAEHRLKDKSGHLLSSVNMDSEQNLGESLGKASSTMDSLANSASAKKDFEAFGRSLESSILSNDKCAWLNQTASKDADTDPNRKISKNIEGLDGYEISLIAGNSKRDEAGDSFYPSSGIPSDDHRTSSSPEASAIMQRKASLRGSVSSLDSEVCDLSASRSYNAEKNFSAWLNQFDTLKNDQLLLAYSAHNATTPKEGELPLTFGQSSSILDSSNPDEKSNIHLFDQHRAGCTNLGTTTIANELLHLNQHQVPLRPKKRKTATSELLLWYKEASDGLGNISTPGMPEADWSIATNHLREKVQVDTESIDDIHPVFKSKRRLISTTQLMQHLFTPPPSSMISDDASSTYGSLAYAVCRETLGGSCSVVSRLSDRGLHGDSVDQHFSNGTLKGGQCFVKLIGELLGRTKKLENDFLRLDKTVSVLDLRLEYQDLEKFSIINRLAKFHGRGQMDNVETSSIDAMTAPHRPCVQRYVTAMPLPRSLPETLQCLSL